MKKIMFQLCLFCYFIFSSFGNDFFIEPATKFKNDLKYQGYFDFKNIKISNYYELEESFSIDINNDGIVDYLILLTPKSIIPPLDDDFDFKINVFYKRKIVEIISDSNEYKIGKSYCNLISNLAGLGSGFDGIALKNDNIIISHSKPNGNIVWEIKMFYHYSNSKLCLYKIQKNQKNLPLIQNEIDAENVCFNEIYEFIMNN